MSGSGGGGARRVQSRDGAGGELGGGGGAQPLFGRDALRAQRGDNTNFFRVVCASLTLVPALGVRMWQAEGRWALRGQRGLGVRISGLAGERWTPAPSLPACAAALLGCPSRGWEAQGAFVWAAPLGPRKCRLPREFAGVTGRLDR